MTSKHERESDRRSGSWARRTRAISVVVIIVLVTIASVVAGTYSARASSPPTVNGLFYGDGDEAIYWKYQEAPSGSDLYVHLDGPILYVALVVDRSVNDNVCAPQSNAAYTQNAGWPNHRDCDRLTDSEYFEFTLECPLGGTSYNWLQGYAAYVDGVWRSDASSGAGLGTPPPSYVSSSSWVWNVTNYVNNFPPPVPWDLYLGGSSDPSAIAGWKSPFLQASPDIVVGLDGYPETGPIVYSSDFEWEWPMVYEWSADLAAACGGSTVYVLAGSSHHSPGKMGEDDPFDGENDAIKDMGDLPDSYSTTEIANGPWHEYVITDTVQLGPVWDPEKDGQPSPDATGDDIPDDDEDGVQRGPQSWTNNAMVDIILDVQGDAGAPPADVGLWLDWDGDGTGSFEADEFYPFPNLTVGITHTVQITVPDGATYSVGNTIAARARIFDDESNAPGGSLDWTDYQGAVKNGEVEDYIWEFTPTAITLDDFSARSSTGSAAAILAGLLLLSAATILALRYRRRAGKVG